MDDARAALALWGLEDAAAKAGEVIDDLTTILNRDEELPSPTVVQISKVLSKSHKLKEIIIAARRGTTVQKKA